MLDWKVQGPEGLRYLYWEARNGADLQEARNDEDLAKKIGETINEVKALPFKHPSGIVVYKHYKIQRIVIS
jgi:hypothetical protein